LSATASLDHQPSPVSIPFTTSIPARVGRFDAELLGISADDVHLRHCGSLKVGSEVPLTFTFAGSRVQTTARVRSCRVATIGGSGPGATTYESRLELLRLSDEEQGAMRILTGGRE